ncbi:putative nucleic acid-binding Zn ribbon protein [Planomicrobium sp. HSC-17F08]|nr:putative nucleic acid-binding Zn ribbon protein [Planomicrobium sp. HSC-17F08]
MPLMKDVKEEAEIRKRRNLIRIITWVIVAIVLVLVWYFTK